MGTSGNRGPVIYRLVGGGGRIGGFWAQHGKIWLIPPPPLKCYFTLDNFCDLAPPMFFLRRVYFLFF